MDRMIYLAMSGAKATLQRQEALAHNLANAASTGFRAQLTSFRAAPVQGPGAPTRVFAMESTPGHDDTPGEVRATGRPLDVAARGKAWFAVQGLDGAEAYTRNGSFEVSADGSLVTQSGLLVLGDGGPIQVPPGAQVQFGSDGTVTAAEPGQAPAPVGRLKMVLPEAALVRGEDGLFRSPDGADLPADPNARLQDGALEGSNVNPVATMVGMIAAARQFESQMRMLQNAEANGRAASRLLSINT